MSTVQQSLRLDDSVASYSFNFDAAGVEIILNPQVAGRVRASTVRTLLAVAMVAFSVGASAHEVDDYCDNVSPAAYQAAITDITMAAF